MRSVTIAAEPFGDSSDCVYCGAITICPAVVKVAVILRPGADGQLIRSAD
jgi:hypothetical protein